MYGRWSLLAVWVYRCLLRVCIIYRHLYLCVWRGRRAGFLTMTLKYCTTHINIPPSPYIKHQLPCTTQCRAGARCNRTMHHDSMHMCKYRVSALVDCTKTPPGKVTSGQDQQCSLESTKTVTMNCIVTNTTTTYI